jgi:acid phosphatase type 7
VEAQQAWLRADLVAFGRQVTPHGLAHRPFYCSNAHSWCGGTAWIENPVRLAFEPLFYEFGVDVFFAAHEHSVEITYPMVNGSATNENERE